jgi:glyoxylase-like metal-dependent hydrolase (beta-lactamase superfamily II)
MKQAQREIGAGLAREVAPGVFYTEVGEGISRANVFFVQAGPAWVLIDAGVAGCGPLIRQIAEALFGETAHPAAILLTHVHPDHAGAAAELARQWDCPVYVHPDEMPVTGFADLAAIEPYANPLDCWMILPILRLMPRERVKATLAGSSIRPVARAFDSAAALPGLPGWECIPTPGHTPGHAAYYRRSDRVLIAGDAVVTVELNSLWGMLLWFLRRSGQKVSGPPWYSTWKWQQAKQSATVLAALGPHVLATGHGTPMFGAGIAQALRAFTDRFSGRAPRRPL